MAGWKTNYDDFDEVIVLRVVCGERLGTPIPAAEAAEAVRRLAQRGYDDGQIAYRLGFRRRSVVRIRQRRGIPAALPVGSNHYDRLVDAPSRARSAG
jgi:hypothetical protein